MAPFVDLPVEIIDQIVSEITLEQQGTLSSLSRTCRDLYLHITPYVYRTLRLNLQGQSTHDLRTKVLQTLAPPGSYTIPPEMDEDENDIADRVDRKGKGAAGRQKLASKPASSGTAGSSSSLNSGKLSERTYPLRCIREVSVEGYWSYEKEQYSDDYTQIRVPLTEGQPFLNALEGLLWSLDSLEGFTWNITKLMPSRLIAAVARFPMLKFVTLSGDSHLYHTTSATGRDSATAITNDPTFFSNCSLSTIRALHCGDYNECVLWGDVIRSPTNWANLRNLEIDLSPGLISMLVELEPLEPDILACLLRPPPPRPGTLRSPKLQLHQLKLRDVSFQHKGTQAVSQCIDPGELRDLDLDYCQDAKKVLTLWQDNKLKKIERISIKEEISLSSLARFLKQFGPEGECRSLRTLELCCWHSDRPWSMFDAPFGPSSIHGDYSDSEYGSDGYESLDDLDTSEWDWLPTATSFGGMMPHRPPKRQISQPWRSIKDLAGNRTDRSGLERLILDMRPRQITLYSGQLPNQETFFQGFWRLRELAVPVCYEKADQWNHFVETVSNLPNLEYLLLLNARTEPRSGQNYVPFDHHVVPFNHPLPFQIGVHLGSIGSFPPPPVHHHRVTASSRSLKRKKEKERQKEPDKLYVDALSIAAKNRLHVHGNGVADSSAACSSLSQAVPSSSSSSHDTWNGKLKYIGIRSPYGFGTPAQPRVWKVVVSKIQRQPKKQIPEPSQERIRSLRSATKKRKLDVEQQQGRADWRFVSEGEWKCELQELVDEKLKRKLADGLFLAMDRSRD